MSGARGISLIWKSVRDFFGTKGFLRIFDGFFLQTKGFLPKAYEIFWSEMPLGQVNEWSGNDHIKSSFSLRQHVILYCKAASQNMNINLNKLFWTVHNVLCHLQPNIIQWDRWPSFSYRSNEREQLAIAPPASVPPAKLLLTPFFYESTISRLV